MSTWGGEYEKDWLYCTLCGRYAPAKEIDRVKVNVGNGASTGGAYEMQNHCKDKVFCERMRKEKAK